jgi:sn-glycerol 3-phosphate transport system ATP-binding protein
MVYVTHDQTEAMSMADQVVLLRGGCIEQVDTPDGLYARPATEFAARFIGTPPMNLITLDRVGGELVPAGSGGPAIAGAPAGAARLGIRPEHIRLAGVGDAGSKNSGLDHPGQGNPGQGHAGVVAGVEYFGADSIVSCSVGSTSGVAVRVTGHLRAAHGDNVQLQWDAGYQHYFDADGVALTPET